MICYQVFEGAASNKPCKPPVTRDDVSSGETHVLICSPPQPCRGKPSAIETSTEAARADATPGHLVEIFQRRMRRDIDIPAQDYRRRGYLDDCHMMLMACHSSDDMQMINHIETGSLGA